MARLDELFDVRNGLQSSRVHLLDVGMGSGIPYVRPAKTQQRTIAGWIDKSSVPAEHRYPKHSIFVSTNGEGSHTYAYVSDFEFVANSDVSILVPKRHMALAEKIFYAKAITLNRDKFSYGRKPKGERLKCIELPDSPPEWVRDSVIHGAAFNFSNVPRSVSREIEVNQGRRGNVRVDELFEVVYGVNLELKRLTRNPKGINFVARTSKDNGVSAKVQRMHDVDPTEGMVLTVAAGGSVLETFLQIEPFYSGRDLFFLKPKIHLTVDELIYYATCIRANQYRYSYGRQANKTLRDLKIPAPENIPEWVNGTMNCVSKKIKDQVLTLTL